MSVEIQNFYAIRSKSTGQFVRVYKALDYVDYSERESIVDRFEVSDDQSLDLYKTTPNLFARSKAMGYDGGLSFTDDLELVEVSMTIVVNSEPIPVKDSKMLKMYAEGIPVDFSHNGRHIFGYGAKTRAFKDFGYKVGDNVFRQFSIEPMIYVGREVIQDGDYTMDLFLTSNDLDIKYRGVKSADIIANIERFIGSEG